MLEAEHALHNGIPDCRTPKEAAIAWLGVPSGGLSDATPAERRELAHRVTITLLSGESRDRRTVEITDVGIGLDASEMPDTILSLHESNKLTKHYLAGIYGQGGSSTFAVSQITLIASRKAPTSPVAFTLVRYDDLPADEFKTGHYVYLTEGGSVLTSDLGVNEFGPGTTVRHFGYDLSGYTSPVGPNSVYGLLNRVLFDPVMPIWLDNQIHDYRRVIKGARNALNGAVDEGDESARGPDLAHRMRMFYVDLGEYGRVAFEYWVLKESSSPGTTPISAFVNPFRSIILTVNGQNQAELPRQIVRRDAELAYLTNRLIVHIACDLLSPEAKRLLFVSNREEIRRGALYDLLADEIVRALRADDDLSRLNAEARDQTLRDRDENADRLIRHEVARILQLPGSATNASTGRRRGGTGSGGTGQPGQGRRALAPLEIHEPPTFVRIVWSESNVPFYAGQRRYIRLETDAPGHYHDPSRSAGGRINFILGDATFSVQGSTPLVGGRLRVVVQAMTTASVGARAQLRVELSRPGLSTLSDERGLAIEPPPEPDDSPVAASFPEYHIDAVEGPDDPMWSQLDWPSEIAMVASGAEFSDGKLRIYYSTVFPKFATHLRSLEQRDPALAASFVRRYKIWVAVHSLLLHRDQQEAGSQLRESGGRSDPDPEAADATEREERRRLAELAVIIASREAASEAR